VVQHIFLIALLAAITLAVTPANAKPTVLTESCSYVMGDNDTKNDARQLCFLQAKRKLLEKAGAFIQSKVTVQNGRLTKDQVATYSAAILQVEVTKERTTYNGQNMVMELEVRARVDVDDVRRRLSQIADDKSVQGKIDVQQKQIKTLESDVANLRGLLNQAGPKEAKTLRKERSVVVKKINELESRKIEIMKRINKIGNNLLSYVERGMTSTDVVELAGRPRASTPQSSYGIWHNYGIYWVHFRYNIVECIIKNGSPGKNSECHEKKAYMVK
jgi:hypothetical protein